MKVWSLSRGMTVKQDERELRKRSTGNGTGQGKDQWGGQGHSTIPFESVKWEPQVSQPVQFMFPPSFPSRYTRMTNLDLDVIIIITGDFVRICLLTTETHHGYHCSLRQTHDRPFVRLLDWLTLFFWWKWITGLCYWIHTVLITWIRSRKWTQENSCSPRRSSHRHSLERRWRVGHGTEKTTTDWTFEMRNRPSPTRVLHKIMDVSFKEILY